MYVDELRVTLRPARGDMDGDGDFDLADFSTFAVCFGLSQPTTSCDEEELELADLNGDSLINLLDFMTFALLFRT